MTIFSQSASRTQNNHIRKRKKFSAQVSEEGREEKGGIDAESKISAVVGFFSDRLAALKCCAEMYYASLIFGDEERG